MKKISKLLMSVSALLLFSTANGKYAAHVWMPTWNGCLKYTITTKDQLSQSNLYDTVRLKSMGDVISNPLEQVITNDFGQKINCSVEAVKGDSFMKFSPENTLNIYGEVRKANLQPLVIYPDGTETAKTNSPSEIGKLIRCPLKMFNPIEINASQDNILVNICTPVTFEPGLMEYDDIQKALKIPEQSRTILFYAKQGKEILVNVDYSITFRSLQFKNDVTLKEPKALKKSTNELKLVFNGEGRTIFNLKDGAQIIFDGLNNKTSPIKITKDDLIVPSDFKGLTEGVNRITVISHPHNPLFQHEDNMTVDSDIMGRNAYVDSMNKWLDSLRAKKLQKEAEAKEFQGNLTDDSIEDFGMINRIPTPIKQPQTNRPQINHPDQTYMGPIYKIYDPSYKTKESQSTTHTTKDFESSKLDKKVLITPPTGPIEQPKTNRPTQDFSIPMKNQIIKLTPPVEPKDRPQINYPV